MERLAFIARLAARDLRHRPAQAVLLLARVVVGALASVTVLTAIPASMLARPAPAVVLQTESA